MTNEESIEHRPMAAADLAAIQELIEQARAVLNSPASDLEQMAAIKLALLRGNRGYVRALQMAAFLAVITNDLRAWRYVDDVLLNSGDPALGWLTFHKAQQVLGSGFDQKEWFHLIENSASKGFLPAQMKTAKERGPKLPIVRQLYLFAFGVRVLVSLIWISCHDIKDLRLPRSMRSLK